MRIINKIDQHLISDYLKPHPFNKFSEQPIMNIKNDNVVWIEAGNYAERAAELRIALRKPIPTGHNDFWIPFNTPNGEPMGWMRFSFITTVFNSTMFGASEWRPASSPAPAEQDLLPLPVAYVPEGFSPPL